MVKATVTLISIYDGHALIKQHVITDARRHTDYRDFPPNAQLYINRNATFRSLTDQASQIGEEFRRLIESILSLHAFMNLRRALALLNLAKKHPRPIVNQAALQMLEQKMTPTPDHFKHLIAAISEKQPIPVQTRLSFETESFLRPGTYFEQQAESAGSPLRDGLSSMPTGACPTGYPPPASFPNQPSIQEPS